MKIKPWLFLILLVLFILNLADLFYFNIFTHSLPSGIYIKTNGVPKRGSYAATCLTSSIAQYGISRGYVVPGSCGTGTVLVLKIIQGLPGDRFVVKDGFFELNGHFYRIMEHDSAGRKLDIFYQQKQGVVDRGKYILLSDYVANSWDSRYWGPVGIQFLLKPLWILKAP